MQKIKIKEINFFADELFLTIWPNSKTASLALFKLPALAHCSHFVNSLASLFPADNSACLP